MEFVTIPKTRTYDNKRYKLMDTFVSKKTAGRLKDRYKKKGYLVRIFQQGGVMHYIDRYHVYARKGK